jgi:hypothetical protein
MASKVNVIAIAKSNQALCRQFAVGIAILVKVLNNRRASLELPAQGVACSQEIS